MSTPEVVEQTLCSCGKPSTHEKFMNNQKTYYCCEHWVKAGNPPTDFHIQCLITNIKLHPTLTEWGPVKDSTRQQAMVNMYLHPEKRKEVLELLCKQMGSVAKGEMEFRRRYPELFEEESVSDNQ